MKQLTVLSGKGGTGKTTITASLAVLAKNTVVADCDVDALDLHILLHPRVIETQEFKGAKLAVIYEFRMYRMQFMPGKMQIRCHNRRDWG